MRLLFILVLLTSLVAQLSLPGTAFAAEQAVTIPDSDTLPVHTSTDTLATMVISEIVADPQNDWSSSDFDGHIGDGPVTGTDEYIELFVSASEPVDLRGWYVLMEDGTDATQSITQESISNDVVIDTATPGSYVVIGNPAGTINNSGRVSLYDSQDQLIDQVVFGDTQNDTGAPNANATGSNDESLSRNRINSDSGVNADDFMNLPASPGRAAPNSLPDIVIEANIEAQTGKNWTANATIFDFDQDMLTVTWAIVKGTQQTTMTGQNIKHVFTVAGEYSITTTVDDELAQTQDTISVTVTATATASNKKDDQPVNLDTPPAILVATALTITECMPDPEGSDDQEWIELYNPQKIEVSLEGWVLDDAEGGSKPYALSDTMPANSYLLIKQSDSGLALNNNQDQVRLFNPAQKVTQNIQYTSSKEGQSFARDAHGVFIWTITPTPGEANTITIEAADEEPTDSEDNDTETDTPEDPQTVSIGQAIENNQADAIKVQGVVVAAPGVFSDSYFYLQDDSRGSKISFTGSLSIQRGQTVSVIGTTKTGSSEPYIKAQSVEVVSKAVNNSDPQNINAQQLSDQRVGSLIRVVGQVSKQSGNTFYISSQATDIKVSILEATGIKKPSMKKEDFVTITGILSKTSGGYRILPRNNQDIVLGKDGKLLPSTGFSWPQHVWIKLATFVTSFFCGFYATLRLKIRY